MGLAIAKLILYCNLLFIVNLRVCFIFIYLLRPNQIDFQNKNRKFDGAEKK